MSELVYNLDKKKVKEKVLSKVLFDGYVRRPLMLQVLQLMQTNQRLGTSAVKNRHNVSGSTRKIYRQKGTGNARHGDIKAPLFVGGGQAFGPHPRSWYSSIPEKFRKGALKSALNMKREEKKLLVLDEFELPKIGTREAGKIFEKMGFSSALLVMDHVSEIIKKSVRNLPSFKVCTAAQLNLMDILHYDGLLVTMKALEVLEGRFGGKVKD